MESFGAMEIVLIAAAIAGGIIGACILFGYDRLRSTGRPVLPVNLKRELTYFINWCVSPPLNLKRDLIYVGVGVVVAIGIIKTSSPILVYHLDIHWYAHWTMIVPYVIAVVLLVVSLTNIIYSRIYESKRFCRIFG